MNKGWAIGIVLLIVGLVAFDEAHRPSTAPKPFRAVSVPAAVPNDDVADLLSPPSPRALPNLGLPEVKGGETYKEFDARRDVQGVNRYSGGYGCTDDCSGHDAGREWAELHGVEDPDECGGNSWSFEEGCRSYAEEKQEEAREESGEDAED